VLKIVPSASRLKLRDAGDGWLDGRLTFRNQGECSAVVRWSIPGFAATVEPSQYLLDEGAAVTVSVALEARLLSEGQVHVPMEWHANDQRQSPIHLEAVVRRGRGWHFPLSLARRSR
jgi:hypothetical protein